MKPLVLVLLFSQLAFAQSDVGGIEPSSNYHPSLLEYRRMQREVFLKLSIIWA